LFHKGTIGIKKRNNTQKQYDLMTNLVSSELLSNNPFNSKDEFLDYFLLRRIKSMGLIQNRTGEFFLSTELKNKKVRTSYLNKLVKEDKIKEIKIDGLDGTYYAVNNYLDYNQNIQNKVSFIAPLDNLIWDRLLVKDLFDFEYTWEVYTPIVKRKYGYYVLPMIYKTEMVGRIEFALNRNNEPLEIINIWYEDSHKITKQFESSLQKALNDFSKYLNIN
jgi:hypothetical protein